MITTNNKISILWRNVNSSYAHANRKHLIEEFRTIGSSNSAVNTIISNAGEQKAIMEQVLGLSSKSQDWDKTLKSYWHGFREEVPMDGKVLNLGFIYDIDDPSRKEFVNSINSHIENKDDKLTTDQDLVDYIENRLLKVHDTFNKSIKSLDKYGSNRDREAAQTAAYKAKWDSISMIEGERHKVGRPIEAFDFILYRYCLNYKDVANEFALINKSANIRLYLYSEVEGNKEKERIQKANTNRYEKYLELVKDIEKAENVLYALGKGSTIPKNDVDKLLMLDEESKLQTELFMTIANDPQVKLKGEIEKLIVFNILNRFPGSQIIVDGTDPSKTIGNTMEEAISYFSNVSNKALVSEYRQRYKAIPTN
jgi:hypothetical protein